MEKKNLKYVRTETRETDMFPVTYNIFTEEDGRQLAVKVNIVSACMGALVEGQVYALYLKLNACEGIQYGDTLIFLWGGRIIRKRNDEYEELNKPQTKKPLSKEDLFVYTTRFFGRNGISL